MQALSPTRLTANAFRILGLGADASQADIDSAARRMRLFSDPRQIPSTPWDLPSLGPLGRARNEVELAVSRLNEPHFRIDERMFWLADNGGDTARSPSAPACAAHDAALMNLHRLQGSDPSMKSARGWGDALQSLIRATRDEQYRRWFLDVENAGRFEKKAAASELGVCLAGMEQSIAESLATIARDALEHDRFEVCDRAISILRAMAPGDALVERPLKGIVDRIEDLLVARCDRSANALYRGINWERTGWTRHVRVNRKCCRQNDPEFHKAIRPLMERLEKFDTTGERRRRVAVSVTRAWRNLGLAWARARGYRSAHAAMRAAKAWADTPALLNKINSETQSIYNQRYGKKSKTNGRWSLVWVGVVLASALRSFFSSTQESSNNVPVSSPMRIPALLPPEKTYHSGDPDEDLAKTIRSLQHQISPSTGPALSAPMDGRP